MATINPATWISPQSMLDSSESFDIALRTSDSSSDLSESPIIRMEHSRYSISKDIKGSSQTREFT